MSVIKEKKAAELRITELEIVESIEVGWFQFDQWSDGSWSLSGPGGDYLTNIDGEALEAIRRAVLRIEATK